jgi:hypothetical protein
LEAADKGKKVAYFNEVVIQCFVSRAAQLAAGTVVTIRPLFIGRDQAPLERCDHRERFDPRGRLLTGVTFVLIDQATSWRYRTKRRRRTAKTPTTTQCCDSSRTPKRSRRSWAGECALAASPPLLSFRSTLLAVVLAGLILCRSPARRSLRSPTSAWWFSLLLEPVAKL